MQYLNPSDHLTNRAEEVAKTTGKTSKTDGHPKISVLYGQYADLVYRKCVSMLNDPILAEDAVQDIFTKVYLNLDGFRQDAKYSSWIFSITYNYCVDLLRKTKRQSARLTQTLEVARLLEEETVNETRLEGDAAQLKKILENISDDDKDLLVMKYQEDMPIREIASRLDKSESAVKMQLLRARDRARRVHLAIAS